jgi:cytidylate kinase
MPEFPEKKQIITIAGKPGSGKTTTRDLVAAELGFNTYSTGEWFREISSQRGLDLLAGNLHAETDRSIDDEIDQRQRELGINEDQFVIDGRLAWHFIPNSFKVYLHLDAATAAQRIIDDPSASREAKELVHDDPEAYAASLHDRLASENVRYLNLYGVDPGKLENYDLVVDTSTRSPEEVSRLVVDGFQRWIAS